MSNRTQCAYARRFGEQEQIAQQRDARARRVDNADARLVRVGAVVAVQIVDQVPARLIVGGQRGQQAHEVVHERRRQCGDRHAVAVRRAKANVKDKGLDDLACRRAQRGLGHCARGHIGRVVGERGDGELMGTAVKMKIHNRMIDDS